MINDFDNKNIQSFEYDTTIISDGNIVGTCELGNATIQMLNDSNQYSTLKGQWIKTIHGSFYVYDVEPVQEKVSIKLSCYDIKYKLDSTYDSSLYYWPMTLKTWRDTIAMNCGITFDDTDFLNSNLVLEYEPYIKENPSNRDVIKLIAQAAFSFVTTDKNDIFYFRWFEEKNHCVNDWIELTTEKEQSNPINVAVLGRGDVEDNVKWPEIMPSNPVEFRIDNNYILDPQETGGTDRRYEVIEKFYNQINGFSYLVFNMRSQDIENKLSIELGHKVSYKDIWDNELTAYIMSKKITYLGGNPTDDNNYEITLSAEAIKESSTDYSYSSSIEEKVNKVNITVDKQNQTIQSVVSQTEEQNQKIAQITQTVNEIKSEISEVADITISADGYGNVSLENINKSEPIYIKIHPTNKQDISYLYTNDNLYPSNDLYPKGRTIRFETEEYRVDYELPNDLLYYDENNYDEFILDYDAQSCVVNKKVGYNADGSKYLLEQPTTIEYSYPTINLEAGNYTVSVLGYETSYLFVRMMVQNIYTEQFATKMEMNSAIMQTAESITSEVSKKYTTKDEMNSAITQTANAINLEVNKKVNDKDLTGANLILRMNNDTSEAQLNADKIDLAGKEIDLTSDNITINSTNFKLDEQGNMECSSGTFRGNVNTDEDLIVGDNLYIGRKQETNVDNVKQLFFTDNSYIRRQLMSGKSYLKIFSDLNLYLQCKGTDAAGDYEAYLYLYGNSVHMNSNPTISSDKRLKQNIKDIDVSWIDELKIKEYEYKSNKNKKQIGLIAQDYLDEDYSKYFIEKAPNENGEEFYSISYGNITNALIKYCQELKTEIETLKKRIEVLNNEKDNN